MACLWTVLGLQCWYSVLGTWSTMVNLMVLHLWVGCTGGTIHMRSNVTWRRQVVLFAWGDTAGTNENEELQLLKYEWKTINGTKGTAGYINTKIRLNGVIHGISTAEYRVAWHFGLELWRIGQNWLGSPRNWEKTMKDIHDQLSTKKKARLTDGIWKRSAFSTWQAGDWQRLRNIEK